MLEITLYELIKSCQQGDKNSIEFMIDKFNPLIQKYAYKLKTQDASSEMTLFFIELLHKIPILNFKNDPTSYALLSYLKKSMYLQYIKLSKESSKFNLLFIPYLEEIAYDCKETNKEDVLVLMDAIKALTPLQKEVILYKYYKEWSDQEIADKFSVTRQSVNRIKNRALKRLRQFIEQRV